MKLMGHSSGVVGDGCAEGFRRTGRFDEGLNGQLALCRVKENMI